MAELLLESCAAVAAFRLPTRRTKVLALQLEMLLHLSLSRPPLTHSLSANSLLRILHPCVRFCAGLTFGYSWLLSLLLSLSFS